MIARPDPTIFLPYNLLAEPMLFRIASAYEKATRHRMSPPEFGPLEEKK